MGNQNETFFASCFFPVALFAPKSSCFLPLCFYQQERSGYCLLVHQLVALSYILKISCNYTFCRNSSTYVGYQTKSPRNPPTKSPTKQKSKLFPVFIHIFPILNPPKVSQKSSGFYLPNIPKKKLRNFAQNAEPWWSSPRRRSSCPGAACGHRAPPRCWPRTCPRGRRPPR